MKRQAVFFTVVGFYLKKDYHSIYAHVFYRDGRIAPPCANAPMYRIL